MVILVVPGMSEASSAQGANEATLILMPGLEFQWPHWPTWDLSQGPPRPQNRMSPVLRYTAAPILFPEVKSLLTPPPLLSMCPQGPALPSSAVLGKVGWLPLLILVPFHLGPRASHRLLKPNSFRVPH